MPTPRRLSRPVNPRTDSPAPPSGPQDFTATDNRLLYTPDEAAELLQIRSSWLRRKAAARQIPCTFLGKHLRFSPADLAAIVAAAAEPAAGRRHRRRPARPPSMPT